MRRNRTGLAAACSGLAALVGVAGVVGVAGQAAGQHAIGDGRLLDSNLQPGTGGLVPQRGDMASEMRFRNAIVTGNAPGGLSFRGDVGYRAPGEFFGALGSNEQFAFRRDTLYSGLAGMGIRGTDALQYQFALTTGNRPPRHAMADTLMVPRSGAGTSAAVVTGEEPAPAWPGGQVEALEGADERGLALWTLRAPSLYGANRNLEATLLTVAPGDDGRVYGMKASELRGLSLEPLTGLPRRPEREPGEAERGEPGTAQRVEPGLEREGAPARAEERAPGGVRSTPLPGGEVERLVRAPYEELVSRLEMQDRRLRREEIIRAEEGEAGDEGMGDPTLAGWQARMAELRRQLTETGAARTHLEEPGEVVARGAGEGELSPETLSLIRGAALEVENLVPEGFDAHATHMRAGQELLKAGRYFDAEERFTSALAARRGDAMAAVGRVHAQIGASMFRSAALNLRALLIEHPEVAGVRYSAELLPRPARLQAVKDHLAGLLDDPRESGRDWGLLLAYVGHQTGDGAALERGLGAMERAERPADAAPDQLERLAELLRGVWAPEDR